jgi:hypothetical protein
VGFFHFPETASKVPTEVAGWMNVIKTTIAAAVHAERYVDSL